MSDLDLVQISTIWEARGETWHYRFHEDQRGVRITRTKADNPLWHHAVMTKGYAAKAHWFVAMCAVDTEDNGGFSYFSNLQDAFEFVRTTVPLSERFQHDN